MDYEEKYKIALERATQSWECGDMTREHLEYLFPELAEPEDEKIRKMLIEFFGKGAKRNSSTNGISDKDILDWLEKQGNKPQGKSALEAIHEQKADNANKVERKFKVGDYIVNDYCKGKVIELTTDAYLLDTEQGIPFSCEHNAHLWSIQDAKDGDVLYSPKYNVLWIFKDKETCHVAINLNYANFISFGANIVIPSDICPATKEQRNLLFQKMEEAGCRWNSTEKRLEEIEGGKESESKKEKRTYSTEESNCIIQDTISICEQARKKATNEIDYENVTRCIEWLKSLKHRYTWKPSKEQMDTLLFISSVLKDEQVIVNLEELKTLYNDLMKL